MVDEKTGRVCLFLALLLLVAPAVESRAQSEGAPSLEFNPSSDLVPEPRQVERSQPQILFTRSIGGFGIGRGSFNEPVDVVHDDDENYYVLDAGNQRVQVFDRRDNQVSKWGAFGASEGLFKRPTTITRDEDGAIYVVDTGNHRIQKFDESGNFLTALGRLGATAGRFNNPTDMTFDDAGRLYVLDAGNNRIQKFSSKGIYEDEWGRFVGGRSGDFTGIDSIAYDDERLGRLYLLGSGAEEGVCLVQILNIGAGKQEVVESWTVDYPEMEEEPCTPTRIRIDNRNDYVYILDHAGGVLRRFSKNGRYIDSIWEVEEPLKGPMGFSVEVGRRIVYIADTENSAVQIFTLR